MYNLSNYFKRQSWFHKIEIDITFNIKFINNDTNNSCTATKSIVGSLNSVVTGLCDQFVLRTV